MGAAIVALIFELSFEARCHLALSVWREFEMRRLAAEFGCIVVDRQELKREQPDPPDQCDRAYQEQKTDDAINYLRVLSNVEKQARTATATESPFARY